MFKYLKQEVYNYSLKLTDSLTFTVRVLCYYITTTNYMHPHSTIWFVSLQKAKNMHENPDENMRKMESVNTEWSSPLIVIM